MPGPPVDVATPPRTVDGHRTDVHSDGVWYSGGYMGCSTRLRTLLCLITLRVRPVGRAWRLFNSWVVSQLASENSLPAANQCTADPGKRRWQHGRRP